MIRLIALFIILAAVYQASAFSLNCEIEINLDMPVFRRPLTRDVDQNAVQVKMMCREIRQASAEIVYSASVTSSLLEQGLSGEAKILAITAISAQSSSSAVIRGRLVEIGELSQDSELSSLGAGIATALETAEASLTAMLAELVGPDPQVASLKDLHEKWLNACTTSLSSLNSFFSQTSDYVRANLAEPIETLQKNMIFPLMYDMVYITKINEKMEEILAIEEFGPTELERLGRAMDHTINVVLDAVTYDVGEAYFIAQESNEVTAIRALDIAFSSRCLLISTSMLLSSDPGMEDESTLETIKQSYSIYAESVSPLPEAMESLYKAFEELSE